MKEYLLLVLRVDIHTKRSVYIEYIYTYLHLVSAESKNLQIYEVRSCGVLVPRTQEIVDWDQNTKEILVVVDDCSTHLLRLWCILWASYGQ